MKGLSRWLFLCLTIILMSLSFFHLSARLGSIYYFSSIDRVESTLSQFDLSVRGFELSWIGLNPVLEAEVAEHQYFRFEKVYIEIGFWESLLKNQVILSKLHIQSGEIRSYEDQEVLNSEGLFQLCS